MSKGSEKTEHTYLWDTLRTVSMAHHPSFLLQMNPQSELRRILLLSAVVLKFQVI